MLRVITGSLRGKKLHTLPGVEIRPTSDRLRESIFNILSKFPSKNTVLDLFSGTGALGIEAMSRGSEYCVFVEINPKAIHIIEKNIKSCALEEKTRIIQWDIRKNLNCLKTLNRPVDLVFMDPPYHKGLVGIALDFLFKSVPLSASVVIVIERPATEPIPALNAKYQIMDERKYGQTIVSFLGRIG
ncbi:MAG: 16S rRNA (guanine(966)-N(2))-methyltransferase RsmD [Desulfobacteraceae bacterium]|nr:16S rRNA (guanine(966)-N(2))-methyltransferase RsmD [Desulfobacteraceae bacterium]MBU4001997.1 16S rRNA (guanine(966)-N(2))-methyltransferase RsmD [Pseudomonadota bacterium]MBU4055968.1 16S rRNA (guanine(966)-N(2))-methyltransferase RsmD [Pseudomonadota bacterium]